MSVIGLEDTDAAGRAYSEGAEARVYGKPSSVNPFPPESRDHAYWLDAWSYRDELNGGARRIAADYSHAPAFCVPEFERFFVIPVIEESGQATFGEWSEFATGPQAARAGRAAAANCRGVIVAAAEQIIEEDENYFEPIAIFGDVPESLLGRLISL
jgi:hypothetical protein